VYTATVQLSIFYVLFTFHNPSWLRIPGSAQVLENVGVFDGAEKLALLQKLCDEVSSSWVIVLEESVMAAHDQGSCPHFAL
jgi:hypothetical protein